MSDIMEFFEDEHLIPPCSKKTRFPWKTNRLNDETFITLPVFIAYCGIAAALRPWNRRNAKFKAILCLSEVSSLSVYSSAARLFLDGIADDATGTRPLVSDWGGRYSNRDQFAVLTMDRAVFLKNPDKDLDEDARLFADTVVDVSRRTKQHVEAALRRFRLPVIDRDVELLLSEPWTRLDKAFQEGRSPTLSLQRLRQYSPQAARADVPKVKATGPTLVDMHGYGPIVDWGNELARDLLDYKSGRIPWEHVDAGVLISGPSGTGKTTFVRALANTCDVPVTAGSFSSWQSAGSLDDFLKAMRQSFEEAKSKAPSILFVDEVDTFGDRTSRDHNRGYMTAVIAGFLELLDGFDKREGVVVVAACNHPDKLDPAIRRAGRLDRHYMVTLPDARSRLSILGFHSGIKLDHSQAELFSVATDGLSGADIEQLVRNARRVARRSMESLSGNHVIGQLQPITELPEDMVRALAVHEAGHALVSVELGYGELTEVKISRYLIHGKSGQLGYARYGQIGGLPRTRAVYLDAIAVCLAGVAAEMEVFGSFSDGAAGSETADLNRATELATLLEGGLGMGHTLLVEGLPEHLERLRSYNADFRRRVHEVLQSEFGRVRSIVQARRTALDAIADRLSATKALTGDEIAEIVQRHRMPRVSLTKLPRRSAGA